MGKGRQKSMRRSYMKRFASDNIQVKGGTRAKANMPQRRLYTGSIKYEDPWLAAKFPAKVIPPMELMLRGLGDNPVPRGTVLQRLKKFHLETDPFRFMLLHDYPKLKIKLFFNSEHNCWFLIEENARLERLRRSITYLTKERAIASYNNNNTTWKESLLLADLIAMQNEILQG